MKAITVAARWEYDVEHDVAYLTLPGHDGRGDARAGNGRSVRSDNVVLDYDEHGRLVGIEFLSPTEEAPRAWL